MENQGTGIGGKDNVLYGAFGTSGIGDVPPVASATSTVQPPVAGASVGVTTVGDLEEQFRQIVAMLQADAQLVVHPSFPPEQAAQFMSQLATLQELSNQVAVKLAQATSAEDGYLSAEDDINTLGGQVVAFDTAVRKFAGELDVSLVPMPPPVAAAAPAPLPILATVTWTESDGAHSREFTDQAVAVEFARTLEMGEATDLQLIFHKKPFPWLWLLLAVATAGGLVWYVNSPKAGAAR